MTEPWVEKHRPDWGSIQGNNKSLKEIRQWAENFLPGDQPILLVGDPGTGKTSTVQALAEEMGWPINEVNASSARTTEDLQRIASQISSLPPSGGRQLVLLDEIDSLSNKASIRPLEDALKEPPNPVIAIANEEWKIPRAVSNQCKQYDFKLGKQSIKAKIREIAEEEDLDISNQDIGKLATRGNLRAAIQDLQQYAQSGKMTWDDRRLEADNFETVDGFLNAESYVNVSMKPPELVEWLNENLSVDYQGLELGMAHEALAMADRWNSVAQDTGSYKFWKYSSALSQMSKDLRITEPYGGWFDKSYPSYYRHNTPKATDDSAEAKLYRKMKGYETGEFRFGGGFVYFKDVLLPILKNLPEVVRYRLVLDFSLSDDSSVFRTLGISEEDYTNWLEESGEDTSDDTQKGIADW